jgi:hypothetical protein
MYSYATHVTFLYRSQGGLILRILGAQYSSTATAVHTTFLVPDSPVDPSKTPLTPLESFGLERRKELEANGLGFLIIQKTKVSQ